VAVSVNLDVSLYEMETPLYSELRSKDTSIVATVLGHISLYTFLFYVFLISVCPYKQYKSYMSSTSASS
jgi:hypothetical protein